MRDALQAYVKRVQDLAEHVRGNEQGKTLKSLVEAFRGFGWPTTYLQTPVSSVPTG